MRHDSDTVKKREVATRQAMASLRPPRGTGRFHPWQGSVATGPRQCPACPPPSAPRNSFLVGAGHDPPAVTGRPHRTAG
jgi:hypothetical protein